MHNAFKPARVMHTMAAPVPTAEELKNLTPEERIKQLRALEEERKRDMEEAKKRAEEEIQLAEELNEKSKEELEEGEKEEENKEKKKKDTSKKSDEEGTHRHEEESLEERIAKEKMAKSLEENAKQYTTNNLYDKKENDLYTDRLGNPGGQTYEQHKQEERSSEYRLPQDRIAEELNLTSSFIEKMKYKR